MADGFHIDAHGLEDLTRDLHRAAERVRVETDKTVVEVGAVITETAKTLAAQHSNSIPPTIKLRAIPGAAIISAGNENVPLAGLYELGNKGAQRSATTFRHPVFGDRNTWVEQTKHPYLGPALAANRREITRRMEHAWTLALEQARLRPEA